MNRPNMPMLSRALGQVEVTQRIILQDHGHIGLGVEALSLAWTTKQPKVLHPDSDRAHSHGQLCDSSRCPRSPTPWTWDILVSPVCSSPGPKHTSFMRATCSNAEIRKLPGWVSSSSDSLQAAAGKCAMLNHQCFAESRETFRLAPLKLRQPKAHVLLFQLPLCGFHRCLSPQSSLHGLCFLLSWVGCSCRTLPFHTAFFQPVPSAW